MVYNYHKFTAFNTWKKIFIKKEYFLFQIFQLERVKILQRGFSFLFLFFFFLTNTINPNSEVRRKKNGIFIL